MTPIGICSERRVSRVHDGEPDPVRSRPKDRDPEDKLKKEYDQRQDEFVLPERRDVQQILAPSEDKAKAAEAALAAGKDWKEVATTIAGQIPRRSISG